MSKDIEKYKKLLEEERERLIAKVKSEESPEDFGDDIDDTEGEEAGEATELGNRLAIGQALRDRIAEIDGVLNDLAAGKEFSAEQLAKLSGADAPEKPGK